MDKQTEKKIKGLISFCEDIQAQIAWLRGEVLKMNRENSELTNNNASVQLEYELVQNKDQTQ
jgi:hypothetical protein